MAKKTINNDVLLANIIKGIEEVKGSDIDILDLREIDTAVGSEVAEWVLMDYVHIVVHVFQKHIREYYNIESLWGDAKITKIENKY